jgi:hypothetical protein
MVRRKETPLERQRRWKRNPKNQDKWVVRHVIDATKKLMESHGEPIIVGTPVQLQQCRELVEMFTSRLPIAWREAYRGPTRIGVDVDTSDDTTSPSPYLKFSPHVLGAGAFGSVYSATRQSGDSVLAVKEQIIKFKHGIEYVQSKLLR